MALRPKGTFDATLQAQDLRFYRVTGTDESGDPTSEIHCTGLFEDTEGRVYSDAAKLSECSDSAQRAAVKAVSDFFAARIAAKHFDEVA